MDLPTRAVVRVEPNVTPMLDVLLVLLIIFMVATPALLEGFHATPPAVEHLRAQPPEEADIVLGIDAAGRLYLNKRPVLAERLAVELRAIYATRDENEVLYLRAHKELEYHVVLEALEAARASGIKRVRMISEQSRAALASRR
jgi:biopolymer transport protein ExbD